MDTSHPTPRSPLTTFHSPLSTLFFSFGNQKSKIINPSIRFYSFFSPKQIRVHPCPSSFFQCLIFFQRLSVSVSQPGGETRSPRGVRADREPHERARKTRNDFAPFAPFRGFRGPNACATPINVRAAQLAAPDSNLLDFGVCIDEAKPS